jgi:hypothetical protein
MLAITSAKGSKGPFLYSIKIVYIGRKGIEPSIASAIEFTAQPIYQQMVPSFFLRSVGGGGIYLILIKPVQFPLHEPYFDLTPIRVTHTKILRKRVPFMYIRLT